MLCILITYAVYAEDRIVYIQKQDINSKDLSKWQSKGQIIDEFTTHTDVSLMEKIKNLKANWSREGMEDLLQDFSISPEQFGTMIDTLSNVLIRQSNDIPNTSVGRIAIAGFAWKIAGPTMFKFVADAIFLVFFFWFFIWSYKRNFWKTTFVTRRIGKGLFGTTKETKERYTLDKLFDQDSWLSNGGGSFDSDTIASKSMHIIAFCLLLLITLFVL